MFVAPVLVGGATGDALLTRMNDAHPTLVAALARAADAPPAPARPVGRLVLVVIDGVGEPYFDREIRAGTLRPVTWSQPVDTGTPSLSRPSYHTLFTGVAQDLAGVGNNRYAGRARADTVMNRVRDAGGTVAWALETVDWMHGLAGLPHEPYLRQYATHDLDAVAALAASHTLTVVHWVTTDEVAHNHGARSARYDREVRTCLTRASQLHDRLAAALGPAGFTLLVGADHGHVARGGHGGPDPDVVHTRWVRLGGPPSVAPPLARQPETVLAATFTDALGLPPPRAATGCPLPLAGVTSRADCAAITRRRETLDRALAEVRSGANHRAALRLTLFTIAIVLCAIRLPNEIVRSRTIRALTALGAVLAGAAASYALLGPGLTLSAIRTQRAFLVHATLSTMVGALVAWIVAHRITRARTSDTALATVTVPLAALCYVGGSSGEAMLGDVGRLMAPALGLLPGAACAAIALGSLAARRPR